MENYLFGCWPAENYQIAPDSSTSAAWNFSGVIWRRIFCAARSTASGAGVTFQLIRAFLPADSISRPHALNSRQYRCLLPYSFFRFGRLPSRALFVRRLSISGCDRPASSTRRHSPRLPRRISCPLPRSPLSNFNRARFHHFLAPAPPFLTISEAQKLSGRGWRSSPGPDGPRPSDSCRWSRVPVSCVARPLFRYSLSRDQRFGQQQSHAGAVRKPALSMAALLPRWLAICVASASVSPANCCVKINR